MGYENRLIEEERGRGQRDGLVSRKACFTSVGN